MILVKMFLVLNRDHANFLGAFQKRQSIGDCPRSRTAEIPSHRNCSEREWTCSRIELQHQGRSAGSEDHGLGVPPLIGCRHDCEVVKPRVLDQKRRDGV